MQRDVILRRQRRSQRLEPGEALVVEIAGVNRHVGRALAEIADDVHRSHRSRCADDVDLVARTNLGRRGNRGIGRRRVAGRRSNDADAAIVDAADLRVDGAAELAAALDNREQTAGARAWQTASRPSRRRRRSRRCRQSSRRAERRRRRRPQRRRKPARPAVSSRSRDRPARRRPRAGAAGFQRAPLGLGIGVLDAGPRLDQGKRGS